MVKENIIETNLEKGEVQGMPFSMTSLDLGIDSGCVIAEKKTNKAGSVPLGGATDYDPISDTKTKISISRDVDGCVWSYENDDATFCATKKLASLVNTGMETKFREELITKEKYDKIKLQFEKEVTNVFRSKVESVVTNLYIHSFCFMKKLKSPEGKLVNWAELDPEECKPIINYYTGNLGESAGLGLNPEKKNMEVALVQNGKVATYSSLGEVETQDKYFYFDRKSIIPFTLNERGKFVGVSPIFRMLRTIELRRTIINIVEVVLRRFGPQIIVTVGNKDVNFNSNTVPATYLRDTNNNPVDRDTALANYRKAVMDTVKTKIQNYANADSLVHIQEYGYDVKTLNPAASLPDYIRFINTFGKMIQHGILGVTEEGRVDITSSLMKESVSTDLKDVAEDLRFNLINTYNKDYVNTWLEENGLKEDSVYLTFSPIDKTTEQAIVIIERTKSEVIRNLGMAGYEVPKEILEKIGISSLKEKEVKEEPKNENSKDMKLTEKEYKRSSQGEPVPGQKPTVTPSSR